MMNSGAAFRSALQIINCMEREDFIDCFGEETGLMLWRKFIERFDHDIFEFICYCDGTNLQTLYGYLHKRNTEMGIV